MTLSVVVIVLLGLAALYFISIFNRLVRNKNLVAEGWSGIDVQLKKRADLVPNLVQTVKGYMTHERDILENVTKFRAQAQQAGGLAEKARAEGLLSGALGRLFAVAENYPDLKANQNFLELQTQLSKIEDDLQLARRYYNGTARDCNILIESFPSNLVANMFNFCKADFFEIETPADRDVPQVQF